VERKNTDAANPYMKESDNETLDYFNYTP